MCFRNNSYLTIGKTSHDNSGRSDEDLNCASMVFHRLCTNSYWLLISGVVLSMNGIFMASMWPSIFNKILKQELTVSEGSRTFEMWKEAPLPMYVQFYFFNWTNPKELYTKNVKPKFTELGPYTFRTYMRKTDINFTEDIVSFKQLRSWEFDPAISNGTLDDLITNIDVIALTSAYQARYWGSFTKYMMSMNYNVLGSKMTTTRAVRQLLFEGYSDALLSQADSISSFFADIDIPFDKFGWFYKQNNSADFLGVFEMETGVADASRVGLMRTWNNQTHTKYFEGPCSMVNGSAGELYPAGQTKTNISFFSPDLCRSLTLPFLKEVHHHDIKGYRFAGDAAMLANETDNPDNWCFCAGECVPSGALNVSQCRLGAPAFVSYPHFYLADQYYRNAIEGMHPDQEKHELHLDLEPTTGIPLNVAARFQINIRLQPISGFRMYERAPVLFIPMLWFSQTATVTPEIASELSLLLLMPSIGTAVALTIVVIGMFVVILWTFGPSQMLKKKSQKISDKAELEEFVKVQLKAYCWMSRGKGGT